MNRYVVLLLVVCQALVAPAALAEGQPELNPDISVISDVRALMADATPHDLDFVFRQVEIGAQQSLNPFARADVYLRVHDGEIDIEEGYATFTALPAGLGVRAGRYRARVGRFNDKHDHGYPFLDYPLMVREFFGSRGLAEVGVNPSLLFNMGAFPVTMSGDVLAHARQDTATTDPARELNDLTYNGRITAFLPLQGGASFIELGASGGTAVLDVASDLRATWIGVDGKFEWRPNRRKSLEIAGEFLAQRRKSSGGSSDTPAGAFGYVSYHVAGNWNIGGLAEYVQRATNSDVNQKGFGVFAGYALYEDTATIRLLVRNDDLPASGGNETSVQLQLVAGLGKHTPQGY